jgi:hypothetical protein
LDLTVLFVLSLKSCPKVKFMAKTQSSLHVIVKIWIILRCSQERQLRADRAVDHNMSAVNKILLTKELVLEVSLKVEECVRL